MDKVFKTNQGDFAIQTGKDVKQLTKFVESMVGKTVARKERLKAYSRAYYHKNKEKYKQYRL